jgi:hypothetical protein
MKVLTCLIVYNTTDRNFHCKACRSDGRGYLAASLTLIRDCERLIPFSAYRHCGVFLFLRITDVSLFLAYDHDGEQHLPVAKPIMQKSSVLSGRLAMHNRDNRKPVPKFAGRLPFPQQRVPRPGSHTGSVASRSDQKSWTSRVP